MLRNPSVGFFFVAVFIFLVLRLLLAGYLRLYFAGVSWEEERAFLAACGDRDYAEKCR